MSSRRGAAANAVAQEHALLEVRRTLEAFTLDLARLLAGHEVSFAESATRELAQRLRACVDPFLRTGARLSPDFGQFAEVRVQGDVRSDAELRCSVRFEDRSALETGRGDRAHPERRDIELELLVGRSPRRVQECAVHVDP